MGYVKIYKTLSCLEYKLRLYIMMLLSAMEAGYIKGYFGSLSLQVCLKILLENSGGNKEYALW